MTDDRKERRHGEHRLTDDEVLVLRAHNDRKGPPDGLDVERLRTAFVRLVKLGLIDKRSAAAASLSPADDPDLFQRFVDVMAELAVKCEPMRERTYEMDPKVVAYFYGSGGDAVLVTLAHDDRFRRALVDGFDPAADLDDDDEYARTTAFLNWLTRVVVEHHEPAEKAEV